MSLLLPFSTKDTSGGDGKGAGAAASGGAGDESPASLSNWFGDATEDPCLPSLSRKQRLLGFMGCLVLGVACIGLASLYLPVFYLKARKFALLFTLGSLAVLGAMSMLRGPVKYAQHMLHKDRVVFTIVYLLSMAGTLYAAMHLRRTIPTVFFASLQLFALVSSVLAYVPGGISGLKIIFNLWWKAVTTIAMPVISRVFTV
eukprot:m.26148 g.26148  ORF g.26148 m.26148 type:complete len:201 (+) comp8117_c0_seq1:220-822(+)